MDDEGKVLQFMQLAGCGLETAKSYVENSPQTQRERPAIPQMGGDYGGGDDDIPAPLPQTVQNLMYDTGPRTHRTRLNIPSLPDAVNDVMQGIHRVFTRGGRPHRPRPQRQQRPQRQGPRITDGSSAFQKIFNPPYEYMFQGSFSQAKNFAQQSKKWLLVNIQSENVFHCLELNRDCWRNDMIKEFVQENFVFFQKDVIHDEGSRFQSLYMKGIYTFPYIAIIDPITGAEEKKWIGKITTEQLYNNLVEFIRGHSTLEQNQDELPSVNSVQPMFSGGGDDNSNNNSNNNNNNNNGPPNFGGPSLLQPRPPVNPFPTASTEDQLLQMAINESLKDAKKSMVDEDEESEEMMNNSEDSPEMDRIKKKEEHEDYEVEDEEEIFVEEEEEEEEEDKNVGFADESIVLDDFVGKNIKGDKTRLRLVLPNGKREVVEILKSAPLAAIYSCFRSRLSEEQKGGKFDVVFFNRTLENTVDRTLQDDKVLNASLSLNFE